MTCVLAILAILMPRISLIFMALLTNWFDVFETRAWPIFGWFFFPYTTLAYMAGMHNGPGPFWMVLFTVALITDCWCWATNLLEEK